MLVSLCLSPMADSSLMNCQRCGCDSPQQNKGRGPAEPRHRSEMSVCARVHMSRCVVVYHHSFFFFFSWCIANICVQALIMHCTYGSTLECALLCVKGGILCV